MTAHTPLQPASFTLTRVYDASAPTLFRAFADPDLKARWFDAPTPDWTPISSSLEFREGGIEHSYSEHISGMTSKFEARYHHIEPNRRIVYSYEMFVDDELLSVSLTSLDLIPMTSSHRQTQLVLTEQGLFLSDKDHATHREDGTREWMEVLATFVADLDVNA